MTCQDWRAFFVTQVAELLSWVSRKRFQNVRQLAPIASAALLRANSGRRGSLFIRQVFIAEEPLLM